LQQMTPSMSRKMTRIRTGQALQASCQCRSPPSGALLFSMRIVNRDEVTAISREEIQVAKKVPKSRMRGKVRFCTGRRSVGAAAARARVPPARPGPPQTHLRLSAVARRAVTPARAYFLFGHLSECESVSALLCIRVLSIPRDRRYPKSRACAPETRENPRARGRCRRLSQNKSKSKRDRPPGRSRSRTKIYQDTHACPRPQRSRSPT
jgi:hypothetical protein